LALLRTNDPAAAPRINKDRLATFVMSFLFRNPEPATFEEFKAALEQPGMTELAAQYLCSQVENKAIRDQILTMEWQVVTVPDTSGPILTSDVPIIVHGGLKNDDGCLILPLSTNEFFVAYNLSKIDMKKEIRESVATGKFVRAMNKYVVEHRINYVYGLGDSLMAFVARYWGGFRGTLLSLADYAASSPLAVAGPTHAAGVRRR